MAGSNRLVERGRVAMCAWRIETVRILTGIEQQADDVAVPELSGERKRAMTVLPKSVSLAPPPLAPPVAVVITGAPNVSSTAWSNSQAWR